MAEIDTNFFGSFGGATREDLYNRLRFETEVLTTEELQDVFAVVDRGDFVPGDYISEAYEDYALPVGEDSSLIQPTLGAFMLEMLEISEEERVLQIGETTGWMAVLISSLVGPLGSLTSVVLEGGLLEDVRESLKKYTTENTSLYTGDTLELYEDSFDKAIFLVDTEHVPGAFIDALVEEGLLLVPVDGSLTLFRKREGELVEEKKFDGFDFKHFVFNKE